MDLLSLENEYEKRASTYKSETPFGLYTIKFYIQSKFAAVMPHFAGISMLPFHLETDEYFQIHGENPEYHLVSFH